MLYNEQYEGRICHKTNFTNVWIYFWWHDAKFERRKCNNIRDEEKEKIQLIGNEHKHQQMQKLLNFNLRTEWVR